MKKKKRRRNWGGAERQGERGGSGGRGGEGSSQRGGGEGNAERGTEACKVEGVGGGEGRGSCVQSRAVPLAAQGSSPPLQAAWVHWHIRPGVGPNVQLQQCLVVNTAALPWAKTVDGVSCSSGPAAGESVDAAQTLAQALVRLEAVISPCFSGATEAPIRERAHARCAFLLVFCSPAH